MVTRDLAALFQTLLMNIIDMNNGKMLKESFLVVHAFSCLLCE